MNIVPLPAFNDNYIWLLHNQQQAWVVDPGEATGVQSYLVRHQLTLAGILVTHHHADHIGGVADLVALSPNYIFHEPQANPSPLPPGEGAEVRGEPLAALPVIGPRTPRIPQVNHAVQEGDVVTLPELGLSLSVLDIPGHVDDHIAFFAGQHAPPLLFCGDTLFAGGCGRVFEGTPARLYQSLQKLMQLPPDTLVHCAHEYTEANLRFAQAVEPGNAALQARIQHVHAQRSARQPSLPSTLAEELATNPFLRTHLPSVAAAAQAQEPGSPSDPATVFRVLRAWKNRF